MSLAVAGASAMAQKSFDSYAANMDLLQSKKVQKTLGVTESQRTAMNQFALQFTKKLEAYQKQLVQAKKTQADRAKVLGWRTQLANSVFEQLSPAQLKRLREISLQFRGVAALADDKVAHRVGLSEDQLKRVRGVVLEDTRNIQHLEENAAKPILQKYQNVKPKSDADRKALASKFDHEMAQSASKYRPQASEIVRQGRDKIMSILTKAQQSVWIGLLGKPFN